jgi:uncharacterized membrane protein
VNTVNTRSTLVTVLIVVTYPSEDWAARVVSAVHQAQDLSLTDLNDALFFTVDHNGRIRVRWQRIENSEYPDMWQGLRQMIIASLAKGMDALQRLLRELGFEEAFVNRFTTLLQPNWSTIVIFVRHTAAERFLPALSRFGGGIVLQTAITEYIESNVHNALTLAHFPIP